ncbi:GntR family transcriptional regulator [Mycobacterium sp. ITM-2017-0098]|nr:GntR family transcriptional regulator [Mycobacterium sp. ITM-2017-0098]
MFTREPTRIAGCPPRRSDARQIPPEVLYQRQRESPDRLNNSARRTYDLLRSTLVATGRSMPLVERELTDALSASRNTVRAVLQQLAREGLVTRGPKNGTRTTGALVLPIDKLAPLQARHLECRPIGCPPMVRDRLRLPEGWTVVMIESLLLEDAIPLGLSVCYVALKEGQSPDLDVQDPDVLSILERQLGVRIGGSQTTVGAVAADDQTAELVGIEPGAPLVWLEDLIEDDNGQPRALSQLRLRGDRVAFSANAYRPI